LPQTHQSDHGKRENPGNEKRFGGLGRRVVRRGIFKARVSVVDKKKDKGGEGRNERGGWGTGGRVGG